MRHPPAALVAGMSPGRWARAHRLQEKEKYPADCDAPEEQAGAVHDQDLSLAFVHAFPVSDQGCRHQVDAAREAGETRFAALVELDPLRTAGRRRAGSYHMKTLQDARKRRRSAASTPSS
jgi:hypothetical protein